MECLAVCHDYVVSFFLTGIMLNISFTDFEGNVVQHNASYKPRLFYDESHRDFVNTDTVIFGEPALF